MSENSFKKAAEAKKRAREEAERRAAEEAAKKAAEEGKQNELTPEVEPEKPVAEIDAVVQGEAEAETAETVPEEAKETPREESAAVNPAEVPQDIANPQDIVKEAMVRAYSATIQGKTQPKKERIQVVTTKEIRDQLDLLVKNEEIKSMNDLINSLLMMYLEGRKHG